MKFTPLGDSAVVIEVGKVIKRSTLARVRALSAVLQGDPPAGVVDIVPAYTSVTVFYDLTRIAGYEALCAELKTRTHRVKPAREVKPRTVIIPVCYGGEAGPDLVHVARQTRMSEQTVVELHSRSEYLVQAVGFMPGFAYLGGLPARLHTPRRATPRTDVPAGSVGIGDGQTGVYPCRSPGGWNLIGRSPMTLFEITAEEPARLRVGDTVKFKPISPQEFVAWQ